jgi:hypothetical protein
MIIISLFIILIPALFGFYLVFSKPERLMSEAARMHFPLPKEGTTLYRLLLSFWRGLGVVALLSAAFFTYIIYLRSP